MYVNNVILSLDIYKKVNFISEHIKRKLIMDTKWNQTIECCYMWFNVCMPFDAKIMVVNMRIKTMLANNESTCKLQIMTNVHQIVKILEVFALDLTTWIGHSV